MIKCFKPNLTDKKTKIFFGIKIALAVVYTALFVTIFVEKMYYSWDVLPETPKYYFEPSRVIIAIVVWLLGLFLLFFNYEWSKKQNIILSFVVSAVSIVVIFLNTQFSIITDNDYLVEHFRFTDMRIIHIVFNLFILTTLFLIIYAIFGSFRVSIMTLAIFSCVVSLVNYFVTLFRGTALIAVDLKNIDTAANVAGGYSYTLHFRIIICVMVTMLLCFAAMKLGRNPVKYWWFRVAVLIAAGVLVLIGYQKLWASDYYDKLIKVKYFKPQQTYVREGFYIGFFKSIKDTQVAAPDGYSKDAVEKMAKKYPGTKATIKEVPNVIVVMDEAFTDYTTLCDLKINKDNLPFLHSLKDNTISGRLYTPVFGGGTVSTEFESLTSNTMTFEPYGVTSYTTFIDDPMESLASNLKEQGVGKAEALHPYNKEDYKREKVFDLFGFDKFYDIDDFGKDPELCGTFISDNADVEKVIEKYEKYRKTSKKPYFMYNITMQNHSPFLSGNVSGGYKLGYKGDMPEANEYMNLISHSDAAAKKLINYFKKVDEKTIVLFFGDHQPKVEDSFFNQIDKTFKVKNIPYDQRKRISTYYLWTNYDIKEKQGYDISSNFLEELVLKTAGLGMSGYQQMANDIMKKVPVVSIYGCIDKNGKSFMATDKKSGYYKMLNNYHIAQYNDLHDVENRVNKFFKVK